MGDLLGAKVLNAGELQLIAIGDEINYLKGVTPTLLSRPSGTRGILVLDSEVGSFRIRVGDLSVIGATEHVPNTAFADDTGVTLGDGWTIAAGVASSDGTQGADSDLEQTSDVILIEGEYYSVTVTVANRSAGSVVPVVGGTEGTDRSTNATFTEVIRAGSDQKLILRADSTFVGDVDDFSVKIAMLQSVEPRTQTGGVGSLKVRVNVPIAISAPSSITVVGSSASDILAYYWL